MHDLSTAYNIQGYANFLITKTKMLSFSEWSTALKVLFIIDICIIVIGFLLHASGVILILLKSTQRLTNQSLIVVHLSCVTFLSLGTNIYAVHHKCYHVFFSHWFIMIFQIVYIAYILNLILLTLDRVLLTFMGARYQTNVTRPKVFISLACVWVISIGYGMMVKFAPFYKNTSTFVEDQSFIYNGFVVGFTALCYIAIGIKLKSSSRTDGIEVRSSRMSRDALVKYAIPCVIVLCFFLLNTMPSIIEKHLQHQLTRSENRNLTVALIGVNCLNHLIDAFVYIFLRDKRYNVLVEQTNTTVEGGVSSQTRAFEENVINEIRDPSSSHMVVL